MMGLRYEKRLKAKLDKLQAQIDKQNEFPSYAMMLKERQFAFRLLNEKQLPTAGGCDLGNQVSGLVRFIDNLRTQNERLEEEIRKAIKFIDETPRHHDARDTVIDAIKYNLTQALKDCDADRNRN